MDDKEVNRLAHIDMAQQARMCMDMVGNGQMQLMRKV